VNCIRFCPTNRHLASCSDDNTVRVWSLQPVKNVLGLTDEDVKKEGSDDAPSSDASTNGGSGGSISEKDRPFLVLRGHEKEVHAVSWCPRTEFSADSPKLLASASFDATARVWDALNGTCLHVFSRHTDMVYSLAWQPEKGDYLATGSNDKKMCVLKVPRKSPSSAASIKAKGEEADTKEETEAAKKDQEKEKNKEKDVKEEGQYELMLEYEHPGPIYEICWHPSRDQIAVCGKYESVNVVNFKLPA
jgi:WD40 repeat protein